MGEGWLVELVNHCDGCMVVAAMVSNCPSLMYVEPMVIEVIRPIQMPPFAPGITKRRVSVAKKRSNASAMINYLIKTL